MERPVETPAWMLLGVDGHLAHGSPQARSLFGCADDDELARHLETIRPVIATALEHLEQGATGAFTTLGTDSCSLRLRLDRFTGGGSAGVLAVLWKAGDGELDARRLAACFTSMSHVAGAISHEIRGALNSMALNLEVLRSLPSGAIDDATQPRRDRCMNVLAQEIQRLEALVETALKPLRSTATAGAADAGAVLRDLKEFMVPFLRQHRVRACFELPDRKVAVAMSTDELLQALLGMVIESVEDAAPGGELRVILTSGPERALLVLEARSNSATTTEPISGRPKLATTVGRSGVASQVLEDRGGRVRMTSSGVSGSNVEVELPLALET